MMDRLLQIGRELGPRLQTRLSGLGNFVRGAMVGVDRFWLAAFTQDRVSFSTPTSDLAPSLPPSLRLQRLTAFNPTDPSGWKFRPATWGEYCALNDLPTNADPVYFLVILRSGTPSSVLTDLPTSLESHPIRYEVRGPCRAMSSLVDRLRSHLGRAASAISVGRAGPNTAGTLGGLLRSRSTGRLYAVSCQHVLGPVGTPIYHPGPFEGHSSVKIGDVRLSEIALPAPPGTSCSLSTMPDARRLDVGVAELAFEGMDGMSTLDSLRAVDHVRLISSINRRDHVTFLGKESGLVECEVAHVTIWDTVELNGQPYCFGELFTMTPPRPFYLNRALCRDGDSGAWITSTDDHATWWYGMLIAGDGAETYACFAQYIVEACRRAGLDLTP